MTDIEQTAGPSTGHPSLPAGLGEASVALARRWATEAAAPGDGSGRGGAAAGHRSAALLAEVLKDESGLAFTIGFVDRVVRPEDLRVAARNLSVLARSTPAFLPLPMRGAVRLGGLMAPVLPGVVVPIARRVLRGMVGHLVVDARPAKLGPALARIKGHGARLNLNLLGEAVLGDGEADSRFEGTRRLLARDDVDYVSIKVSSIVSQLSMWAFDETVERVVEKLTPLYELAAASPAPKFVNLDMEEYRDLDLTIAVFTRLLDQPQLRGLEAGIVLQTYLPDALSALQRLTDWATARRAAGGAAIKVRIVKGANLAMETVDATLHDWPLATYGTKQDSDANYKRVLAWALTPEHARAVKVGVAGHNLFDIAFAHLLGEARGVGDRVEFEMLLGMAEAQAELVGAEVGGLLLYTPVVRPSEFDVAISYLVRRLEENASSENFMSAVFEIADDEAMFARERDRFLAALADVDDVVPTPHRRQDRTREAGATGASGTPDAAPAPFHAEPDTDPALAANRAWGRAILERAADSRLGVDAIGAARVTDPAVLDEIVDGAVAASAGWAALGGAARAGILRAAAASLAARRADLIEVAAAETGKTLAEGDVEVSEAVDFATFYAHLAEELETVDGAAFVPERLTVVTPPWNFPVAIPAGSTLAALAAGSSVVVKPAGQAKRCGAVMVEALWAAGVPREVLRLVDVEEGELGQRLVAHPAVDRLVLTGAFETAELFRSWRPELPLLAETSGKNAIIVTPSADLDLAAGDVIKSAFGHAGQKCSAASLVIVVGSVARSERFRRQLVDAASTLRVGWPTDPTTTMGPIVEPAQGKLLRGLTELGEGESWLVEPRQLDDTGRLWSPGIRDGVRPRSEFHLTEYFGPVLGIMTASSLDEAIELQNGSDFGLTAGLHTLDRSELSTWLEKVEAGNLYVNRGITGAIVRRQPFGGWKRSSVGAGAKAGGPNYLVHLGGWRPEALTTVPEAPLAPAVQRALDEAVASGVARPDTGVRDALAAAAATDQDVWQRSFGAAVDVTGLGLERDVLRYRPLPVTVRLTDSGDPEDLLRVLLAGLRSGADVDVSTPVALPSPLTAALGLRDVTVEDDDAWHDRVRGGGLRTDRVRLVTGVAGAGRASGPRSPEAVALAVALGGDPAVAVFAQPVTPQGRLELLPFLREQAVSITAHRFGNPDPWSEGVI